MQELRKRITHKLREAFPDLGESVKEFYGLSAAREGEAPHKASGILVCIIGADENEGPELPWPLVLRFGLIVTVQAASAVERDQKGWDLALKVAAKVYRQVWGYGTNIDVTPAKISGIRKVELRSADGTLSGVNYWAIEFFNLSTIEVAIGIK